MQAMFPVHDLMAQGIPVSGEESERNRDAKVLQQQHVHTYRVPMQRSSIPW